MMESNKVCRYSAEQKWPVKLNMYAFIQNENKYDLILNFYNDINSKIKNILFEIKFLDINGNVIVSENYTFEDAFVDGFKDFTPKRKLQVPTGTVDIQYTLIKAEYINCVWKDNKLQTLSDTEEMAKDENSFLMSRLGNSTSVICYLILIGVLLGFLIYYYTSFGEYFYLL